MSEHVLDEINKKMEEVVEGRRYIINQIGSLKVLIEELLEKLGPTAELVGGADLTPVISLLEETNTQLKGLIASSQEIKNIKNLGEEFKKISDSVQSLGEIKEFIDELRSTLSNIGGSPEAVNELKNTILEQLTEIKNTIIELTKKEGGFQSSPEFAENFQELKNELNMVKSEISNFKDSLSAITKNLSDLQAQVNGIEEGLELKVKLLEDRILEFLETGKTSKPKNIEEAAATLKNKIISENPTAGDILTLLTDIKKFLKETSPFHAGLDRITDIFKKIQEKYTVEDIVDDELKNQVLQLIDTLETSV
ncbi:MAG: hypothetical protein ACTSSJ_02195 [Candidatus Odinarchaeia archaeon]